MVTNGAVTRQVRGPDGLDVGASSLVERLRANADASTALGHELVAGLFREAAAEIDELDTLFHAAVDRRLDEAAGRASVAGLVEWGKRNVMAGEKRQKFLTLVERLGAHIDGLEERMRGKFCAAQEAAIRSAPQGVPLCESKAGCVYCNAVRHLGEVVRERDAARAGNGAMSSRESALQDGVKSIVSALGGLVPKKSSEDAARVLARVLRGISIRTGHVTTTSAMALLAQSGPGYWRSLWERMAAELRERHAEPDALDREAILDRVERVLERGGREAFNDLREALDEWDSLDDDGEDW